MSASKIVRSHKDRYCDECRIPHIRKGDLYERWTHFPGDDTYSWVSRDTGKPLGQPVTMSFCRDGALRYDRPSLAEFERREIADGANYPRGKGTSTHPWRGDRRIEGAIKDEQ